MKLLVIGPYQSAQAQSPEARARQALQEASVERYVVYTPQRGEGKLAAVLRILRESRREDFDTVSAQDPFFVGLLAWRIARRAGARFNVQVHADLYAQPLVRRLLAQTVLRHADSVRVVSEKIKKQVEGFGVRAKITVLPIFLDIERFKSVARRPDGKSILWIGRFEKEKDPLRALSILEEVRSAGADARLVMLGEGSMGTLLRERAKGLPVEFPGWQDPLPFFSEVSVALSTSQYEGFGASIVEALAAGVPVVAPDVGVAYEAGATVVPRGALGVEVLRALRSQTHGRLELPMLSASSWAEAWKQSL